MATEQRHKTETGYSYKGHTIHASRGLHEKAMDMLNSTYPTGGKHVLDMGCGSGAFTQRLNDHNFTTTSIDISLDTFKLTTESCQLDLNGEFDSLLCGKKFDVIIALEVIEHLENPLGFLRKIKRLMHEESLLIVSFPNVYLHYAVKAFISGGSFANWDVFQYWNTGHQTILVDWLFEQHLIKSKLTVMEKHFCAPVEFPESPIKRTIYKMFFYLLHLLTPRISKEARLSDALIYKIQSTNPS